MDLRSGPNMHFSSLFSHFLVDMSLFPSPQLDFKKNPVISRTLQLDPWNRPLDLSYAHVRTRIILISERNHVRARNQEVWNTLRAAVRTFGPCTRVTRFLKGG